MALEKISAEEIIITALKEHSTAKVRVTGRGIFSGDGQLQRVAEVENVMLLKGGTADFDAGAKPIWEQFAEIAAAMPVHELNKLPLDGAERHDFYISRGPEQGA